jgi:hypothetical protein
MSRTSLAAVAAVASLALAVPASASALTLPDHFNDEAATAAAIGNQPAGLTLRTPQAAVQQKLGTANLQASGQNLETLNRQLGNANAHGDSTTAAQLNAQNTIAMQQLLNESNQQLEMPTNMAQHSQEASATITGNVR